jgi:hypothetical protein
MLAVRWRIRGIGLLYDSIGRGYTAVRREDPRIGPKTRAALGDARTVVNVGAGTGAYEPADLEVTAVEPSELMIAQRPDGAAPGVRAFAEELPFFHAYWRRPAAYLEPGVRAGISAFALMDQECVQDGLTRRARDLESGEWARRNAELLELDELDGGYRLVVCERD